MFKRHLMEVTEDEWKEVEEINSWIDKLGNLRVKEIKVDGALKKSKIAWKISVLSQAYIYRLYELAESCTIAWNDKHYISALTLARSIIETGVMLCEFDDNVEYGLEQKNLDFLNDDVTKKTFSTRIDKLTGDDERFKAINILTSIQKKNREIPGLVDVYSNLSECAHPNQFGHFQHYGFLDTKNGTVVFKNGKFLEAKFHSILCAFSFVGFGYYAYNRLQENLRKVAELQHQLNPCL